ncbi:MAG: YraN family protein [Chromatiales bacterium]|nr:YraN family protein [Chromatiales bacterium]
MRLLSARRPTQARDGASAERRAEAHLQRHGLLTVTRNFRTRRGEIDLVMRDGETLVFVEVRMRSSSRFGGAAASVDRRKRARLAACALEYIARHHARDWPACRFDVMTLDGNDASEPQWIRNAFDLDA